MRRITLIFALLLSLMGVRQANAETLTANFNSGLPEGWSIVGDITNNSDRARGNSGKGLWTYSKSSTDNYVITEAVEGTFEFYARAYNKNTASEVIIYEYTGSGFGTQLYTTGSLYSSSPSWSKYSFTVTNGTQLAIVLNYAAIDDVTYTQKEQAEGPALTMYDGTTKLTSPYSYDFGLTTSGTTKEFTLKNPGTATLGVSISAEDFEVSPTTANISAGGELTLKVTMPDATANDVITITPNAEGLESFVINVSGTVRDENKLFIDFADGTIPTGWTSVAIGSYGTSWSPSEGYVSQSGSSSYYEWAFQSPKLNFTEGETLLFQTSKYNSSTWYTPSIKVEYSEDGSTWTTIGSAFTDDVYGTWTQRSVNIPTADAKYIRFSGWYVNLTNIYGGELPMEPNMVFSAEDYNFGMISEEKTTDAYTIKNEGRAELTDLTVTSSNANFVVALDANSIDANSTTTFTVSMKADAVGAQEGTITVSAPGQTDVTFNVIGYVLDNSKLVITFDDNAAPEGWENTGWSFANGVATGSYNSSTTSRNSEIITPAVEVAEGDVLAIEAKGNGSYAELYVYTSTDNGATWTKVKDFNSIVRANTTDYTVLIVDGIAAGTYKLKFEGYSVSVNTINGFNYDLNAPELTIDPTTDAAFGKVKASDSKTYTITNSGTGTLTGTITSSDETQFTVSESEFSLGAGESMTFDVILVFDKTYGEKSATISVVPSYDEAAAVVINATATTSDPNAWSEDFEGGTMPTGWIATNWTVGSFSSYENKTNMALAPSSATAGTLVTPALEAKAGEKLTWDAYLNWNDEALKVEYSNDEKANWTVLYNYKAQDDNISTRYYTKPMQFEAPEDGIYYLRFTSTYQNGVDNFNGFKLVAKEHDAIITATTIPATGTQFVEYTASVTVKEQAGKDEELTAKLYVNNEEVATATETVSANGTAAFTLTYVPEEAIENGVAKIVVTYAGGELATDEIAVNIAPAPTLDENNGSLDDFANWGNYPVIALNYSLKKGWNTIILPFAWSDLSVFGEGAKAYAFTGYSATDGLTFNAATELNAQTPYIIYATEEKSTIVFTDVKMFRNSTEAADLKVTSTNGVTFQGTYAPVAAPNMAGKYGVVNNNNDTPTIQKGGSSAYMKGFRAYFDIPESAGVKNFSFTFVDDATGIRQFVATPDNGAIYDLNGNKVKNLVKGQVYIMNGQKILVK